ncbi:MAG TPA: hypothetical protein VMU32_01510 [Solirubrobacteraceae bacterium]|nr:hypothetical protein [Solirubrobacteraceae bacterium]
MRAASPRLLDLRGASVARLNAAAWFGVLGGGAAWALQFLFGMQLGLARCESPDARFPFPVDDTSLAFGAAGVAIGVLAQVAAYAVFRATRSDEQAHGGIRVAIARLHFLAAVGLTVNPLVLTICAMVAVGVPVLGTCHQS